MIFYGSLVIGAAILVNTYTEPIVYRAFQPSPTMTSTPTITLTPTSTQVSTATMTPTVTDTPEFTPTPIMPVVISDGFTSEIIPNQDSAFSDLTFARRLNGDYSPVDPNERFDQPNAIIYGSFTYDKMVPGVQWSALWFRDGELVNYESYPWDGASGGIYYTEMELPANEWLPGSYEVQIFVGETWKRSGIFEVFGEPPTPTPTSTTTLTFTPTQTARNTETPIPTNTPVPTNTPLPTRTFSATQTQTLRATSTLTLTPTRTNTPTTIPTRTSIPTWTLTPTATRRSTIFR